MADYEDMVEMDATKWIGILDRSNLNTKEFPTAQYGAFLAATDSSVGKGIICPADAFKKLNDEAQNNPRKAAFELIFYAVYWLMEQNPLQFIRNDELRAEFNDLLEQANQYKIVIPHEEVITV